MPTERIPADLPEGSTVLMTGPTREQRPSAERINSLLSHDAYGDMGKAAVARRKAQA